MSNSVGEIRQTLEKNHISDNLIHTLMITLDQKTLVLKAEYMNGKFVTEKSFSNNAFGLEALQDFRGAVNTEDKIKSYFKL